MNSIIDLKKNADCAFLVKSGSNTPYKLGESDSHGELMGSTMSFYFSLFLSFSLFAFALGLVPPAHATGESMGEAGERSVTDKAARGHLASLLDLVIEAEARGVEAEQERMVIHLGELFLDYAEIDASDRDYLETLLRRYGKEAVAADAARIAQDMPESYRRDIIEIARDAHAELEQVLRGEIQRPALAPVDTSRLILERRNFTQDGRPVFPSDYVWKPDLPRLNRYFGNFGGQYISPRYLQDEEGKAQGWAMDFVLDNIDDRAGLTFIAQDAPDWAKERYPRLADGSRFFGDMDIDHPATRRLLSSLFSAFAPTLSGTRSTELGYMLFNEPSFPTRVGAWNTGPVSDHTRRKFRAWLQEKYRTIDALNANWQRAFSSFADVTIEIPIAEDLQGQPIWYDWALFNQHRVNDFFRFMNDVLKRADPRAKSHIKLMPWLWADGGRDHGIDFEALFHMGDIVGFDASTSDNAYPEGTYDDDDDYAIDWQSAIMTLDFLRSLQPDQAMLDSENHFFSNAHFHENRVDPDYLRAIFWLAHTHGLDATINWVWGRDEVHRTRRGLGEDDIWFAFAFAHQPRALHSFTRTLMDLNAVSSDIVALQNASMPVRLFYSETSAINRSTYMDDIETAYEIGFFLGRQVGFVTERVIEDTAAAGSAWNAIVVHGSNRVTEGELDALQTYLDDGGLVIMDEGSLAFDEYGRVHDRNLAPSSGEIWSYRSIEELHVLWAKAVALNRVDRLDVSVTTDDDHPTVVWRTARNDAGDDIVSLVNLGTEPATVRIRNVVDASSSSVIDAMTGQRFHGSFTVPSKGVRLITSASRD